MGRAEAAAHDDAGYALHAPAARKDARGGLVSLIAHDMRVPLGPLTLATSSLIADPTIGDLAREFAQIAHAQSAKVGRLMSAALAASGRLPAFRPLRLSVDGMVRATAAAFGSLGGVMEVTGDDDAVDADPTVLGECLLNLAELAAGSPMRTTASVTAGSPVVVSFACADGARCAEAFAKDVPDDADSAFALAGVAVARAFGGSVEVTDAEISLVLPRAGEE